MPSWNLLHFTSFWIFFLSAYFSAFLYLIAGRTLWFSLGYFKEDQPGGGETCPERYASKALKWLFWLNMEDFGGISSRASEIWKHVCKSALIVIPPQEMKRTTSTMLMQPRMPCVIICFHSWAIIYREGSGASQRTKTTLGVLVLGPMCVVHWRRQKARKEVNWTPDIGVGRSWPDGECGMLGWKNNLSKLQCSLPINASQLVLVREYHPGGHPSQNAVSWTEFEMEISTC